MSFYNPVYPANIPPAFYLMHPFCLWAQAQTASGRTANATYLHDVYNPTACFITAFSISRGGVSAGNFDLGIYDLNGNLLIHTGVTVAGAINTLQTVTLSTPYFLPAGTYYFAFWVDNATDTFYPGPVENIRGGAGSILGGVNTNAGGLLNNFNAMGGTQTNGVFVPFLAHIQGGY